MVISRTDKVLQADRWFWQHDKDTWDVLQAAIANADDTCAEWAQGLSDYALRYGTADYWDFVISGAESLGLTWERISRAAAKERAQARSFG